MSGPMQALVFFAVATVLGAVLGISATAHDRWDIAFLAAVGMVAGARMTYVAFRAVRRR